MESRASYFLVGLFILLLTAGLLGSVLWLAKFQSDSDLARFEIVYGGTVTGVGEGSPVRFAGVNVGQVTQVRLHDEDPTKVSILIEIDSFTPVTQDTVATLELEGLTGKRYILLSGGSPTSEPLVRDDPKKPARIAARESSLEQVLSGAPETLESINLLLSRANDLLGDENRANIAGLIANLTVFSATLAESSDELTALIDNTSVTMQNLRGATDSLQVMSVTLKDNVEQLSAQAALTLASIESFAGNSDAAVAEVRGDVKTLLTDMSAAARGLQGTLREVEALVAENRVPIRDFTGSGLYEISALLIELRGLVKQFDRVTTEVERDPARFFFGNSQQGYEAPER